MKITTSFRTQTQFQETQTSRTECTGLICHSSSFFDESKYSRLETVGKSMPVYITSLVVIFHYSLPVSIFPLDKNVQVDEGQFRNQWLYE